MNIKQYVVSDTLIRIVLIHETLDAPSAICHPLPTCHAHLPPCPANKFTSDILKFHLASPRSPTEGS